MRGKHPNSFIINGDLAMKNAIRIVFPESHHRTFPNWNVYYRYRGSFKFRETEADLESDYGSDKLQTRFHSLERCFCMKMESFGMPCDHIVVLLVFLDFREVPKCLVLNRWTKKAKKSIIGRYVDSSTFWDSSPVSRHAHLHFLFTEMAEVAPRYEDDYNDVVNILVRQVMKLGKNMGTRVMQKIKTVRLCMIQ
ncbi:Protein FAR-RED IMPAIRED RESPONSE 1 [Glycine max]|nr:Protein FAR-RED IMPAIRED RESPONSE 1 [Glycine max]